MTITPAELLAIGNERTGRAETQAQVDKFIKSWVHDLTLRGVKLEAEESVTLVDEQPNYVESALTNKFKKIDVITILDTDGEENAPLDEISWQRYKERVAEGHAAGEPKEYARFNETVYLWPKPDTGTYPTAKISGTIYHADSTTISYSDRFRECASQFIIFKIHEKYGYASTKGKPHLDLYEHEVSKIISDQATKEKTFVRYNDV